MQCSFLFFAPREGGGGKGVCLLHHFYREGGVGKKRGPDKVKIVKIKYELRM